jgi:hypothetical protein
LSRDSIYARLTPSIVEQGGARQLVPLRWASVPWWNKPLKDASWLRACLMRRCAAVEPNRALPPVARIGERYDPAFAPSRYGVLGERNRLSPL